VKVQLLSDLHLEHHPDFRPAVAPGADVLVLAGDIGSYQPGSRLTADDFGLDRFAPGPATWPVVLFTPGNHEYDALDFDRTHDRLRRLCEALGIVWLERTTFETRGVRFVGTTLWSDFDALAVRVGRAGAGVRDDEAGTPLTRQLRQRDKAFRAANYYLSTNSSIRAGQFMLAEDIREIGLECQAWLRAALSVPYRGRTVAVTHFAPSLRSHDPRFGLTPGTAGFCNALDDLFARADVWMHGHLHCPQDYVAECPRAGLAHRCRVVANPMGYVHKGEQQGFDPLFVVEIPEAPQPRPVGGAAARRGD
jgi:Calcineurin-like phosphoesterase